MPSSSLEVVFRRRGTPLGAAEELRPLAVEFPTVQIGASRYLGPRETEEEIPFCTLEAVEWEHPTFGFYELDARMNDLAERTPGPFGLRLLGSPERLPAMAFEVLTRCQRLADRRNHESCGPDFDRVLRCHRELHDLSKPMVRADHSHTLDTWQWVLRLNRGAGLAVQLAALFHDIERLASEAEVRIEHWAPAYQEFKDAHARRGAAMAAEALADAGIDEATCRRVARLIAGHEQPPFPGEPYPEDLALLNDADALSFFSLNSPGYMDYFGPEATRRKVAFTLARLRPAARRRLAHLRLRPDVAALVVEHELLWDLPGMPLREAMAS